MGPIGSAKLVQLAPPVEFLDEFTGFAPAGTHFNEEFQKYLGAHHFSICRRAAVPTS